MDVSDAADDEALDDFRCPITRALMRDPVVCADGHSYERGAVERWLRRSNTSPKTGAVLANLHLTQNHALRNSIEQFIERTFKITARELISTGGVIGTGAFKTARRGTLRGEPVAVLELRPGGGAQCAAEVKTFVRLGRHPNLVRFLGLCVTGEPQLLITELAPFGALDTFLEGRVPQLTPPHRLTVATQVCSAMAALAAQGVVHCDLAARNVLVFDYDDADASATRVKVSDFGLAMSVYGATHAYGGAGDAAPFRWMPPEALLRRRFSEKSDVWAYGVTLWELYTDAEALPYALASSDEVVGERVCAGNRLEEPPDCPPAMWQLMQRCWEVSPDRRPRFEQLLADMATMQQEVDTVSQPVEADEGRRPGVTAHEPPSVDELLVIANSSGTFDAEPLVRMLRSSGVAAERAAKALANLASNADSQVAIARAGGIDPLVALARNGTDGQKEAAAMALRNLARNADNHVAIARAGYQEDGVFLYNKKQRQELGYC